MLTRSGTQTAPLAVPPAGPGVAITLLLAACLPALLAYNLSPSATVLNQAAALGSWGAVVMFGAVRSGRAEAILKEAGLASLLLSSSCLLIAALLTSWLTGQPRSFSNSNAGMTAATMVLLVSGGVQAATGRLSLFRALCWAWLVVGVLSVVVGSLQVFTPDGLDGDWIARSSFPGRAVGNMRQPNHLSSLLLWSAVAVIWLGESQALGRRAVYALCALMIAGIVMTASRTGLVGVGLLAAWGVLDRRISRPTRWLLLASPLIYAACWFGLAAWAHAGQHVFGGEARLTAEGDLSSSRFAIWSNTLDLIRQNFWFGVGFGEFNFAWTLTPFPDRPVAFFDHTHNLPLQLLVELGVPLGLLVLALLAYALWRAFVASREAAGLEGTTLRAAFMMVLMMALHSQLEYPLWYAYFLLPTAFVFGLCLGGPASRAVEPDAARVPGRPGSRALAVAGVLVMAGGVLVLADYMRVVAVFSPADDAAPLEQRIARGQRSWFFAHHADYAAVTTADSPGQELEAAKRAAHYLLDTRLMIAWARAYAERGDLDRARHIAQRLREFRNPDSAEFFAVCEAPRTPGHATPFQCDPPSRRMDYRDFR